MQWIERNKLKIYKKIIHPLKVGKAKQDMNRKKREREWKYTHSYNIQVANLLYDV